MIIGICGKSGCGKSTLANHIITATNNLAVHLDIDKVGHNVLLLPEVKKQLIDEFGKSIITDDYVNRKKLGELVFASKIKMDKLTDITWKYMQIEIDKYIQIHKDKTIILDWLLLPKSKYFDMCDIKILLDVPYDIRLKRVQKRDGISEDAFKLRDNASIIFDKNTFDYVQKEFDDELVKKLVRLF